MVVERKDLDLYLSDLRRVRSSHDVYWRVIMDQFLPYRARWDNDVRDLNRGESLRHDIINNTPTRSLQRLNAGLMSYMTSPARDWFKLRVSDPVLNDRHETRRYLTDVTKILKRELSASTFYNALAGGVYPDLGQIGTGFMIEEESSDLNGVRFEPWTVGEYFLDANEHGDIDTALRRRPMTAKQIVERFGYENASRQVRENFDKKNLGHTVMVVHAILPNESWDPSRGDVDGKPFLSYWWEEKDKDDAFLHIGGYDEFPGMAPRWAVRAGEAYGRFSPGWESYGDARELQFIEKMHAELVDKTGRPPMVATEAMRHNRQSLISADVTFLPSTVGAKFEPAIDIKPHAISAVMSMKQEVERRIQTSFFVDLWMALLSDERRQRPTATEVEATRQEVLLQLGPVLEQMNRDLLEPVVTRTYSILERQGKIPAPPPDLADADVEIQFISILHQAQQSTDIIGIRELLNDVGGLSQMRPEAAEKIDAEKMVDAMSQSLGVDPDLILSDDEVMERKRAKAQMNQAQMEGQAMVQGAKAMKDLSGADPERVSQSLRAIAPAAAAAAEAPQGGAI